MEKVSFYKRVCSAESAFYFLFSAFFASNNCCLDKFSEKRVRTQWAREEFGMELGAEKKWVCARSIAGTSTARQFGDFHKLVIRRRAGKNEF